VRTYRDPLNTLYNKHEGLCDRLKSVMNHPLTPAEFERAWGAMVEEFGLHEKRCILKLYDIREKWIGAYFKLVFCGPMSSTQRSESVNNTVKSGYVHNSTPIHEFAKKFQEVLEHQNELESEEAFNSKVRPQLLDVLNAEY